MQEKELALQATQILYDHRAQDILGLRVAHLTVVTDYLVIASGTNALHVRALQEYMEEELEKKGVLRRRVEVRPLAAGWCWIMAQSLYTCSIRRNVPITVWSAYGMMDKTAWSCLLTRMNWCVNAYEPAAVHAQA